MSSHIYREYNTENLCVTAILDKKEGRCILHLYTHKARSETKERCIGLFASAVRPHETFAKMVLRMMPDLREDSVRFLVRSC